MSDHFRNKANKKDSSHIKSHSQHEKEERVTVNFSEDMSKTSKDFIDVCVNHAWSEIYQANKERLNSDLKLVKSNKR